MIDQWQNNPSCSQNVITKPLQYCSKQVIGGPLTVSVGVRLSRSVLGNQPMMSHPRVIIMMIITAPRVAPLSKHEDEACSIAGLRV